jgi:hypothetical protein
VHRILIVTALAGALVYAAWEFREWRRTGSAGAATVAALALVASAGLGVYLRSLRGLRAKLTPPEHEGPARGRNG